jgi:integrase
MNVKNELPYRQYAMFRLFLFTGLRKSELAALEEKDVLHDTKIRFQSKTFIWVKNSLFHVL